MRVRYPIWISLLSAALAAFSLHPSLAAAQVPEAKTLSPQPSSTGNPAAQTNAVQPQAAQPQPGTAPDYTKEALVFENLRTKVVFQDDGIGTRELTAVIHVISQAGVQGLAVLKFPYTSANETVEFDYVRVRKPDGSLVTTPDYNVQDMPADVTRGAPMYSDVHEKNVTVKALGVGDTLEYLVRYRTTKPQVPGQFWFEFTFPKDVIAKSEELEIDVPRDKYVKVASSELAPQTREEGTRKVFTWKTSNLERSEEGKKLVKVKTQEGSKPSVQITTFRSWEDVGRWFGELARSQVVVTPQIQAKAAELTKGLTSNEDKARAIYDFVSTRFHYVSLSFGIGRYQPHPAEDVLENEYGDCKDKHTLLATLLKAAGFEAWPALINSSRKVDPDVPSPGQFDHVVTVVPQGGSLWWLDTTPGVVPFGMLTSNLRNKQALIIPADKPASLITTPVSPTFPAMQLYTANGKLTADGTFTAHMQLETRGDAEVVDRYVFQQYPSAQWKDVVQQFSYLWGFAGEVSAVTAGSPADTSKPFEFAYDYKREKFGDWDNHRITLPLPPMGVEASTLEKNKPDEPFFLGAPGKITYKTKIELPPGYSAKVPPKVDLSEDYADFHSSYEVKDGALTATRQMVIKKPEIPLTEWDGYLKFAKAVSDDKDTWIVLENPWDLGHGSEDDKRSLPADEAYDRGTRALKRGNIAEADEAFHLAMYMSANYRGAHYGLGMVQLRRGNREAALENFREEERLNPDFGDTYWATATTLMSLQRYPEAVTAWREYLKRNPGNSQAALLASQILVDEKDYAAAIEMIQTAVEAAPNDESLRLKLGLMYLRNGERDKGEQIVRESLAGDANYQLLNSAGYFLADQNIELADAKTYLDSALQKIQVASMDSKTSNNEQLKITALMGQIWDSVGWLYFRLGDFEKALPYIRSSWLLTQHAAVGEHLGELYTKLGDKDRAAHTYELAAGAINESPLKEKIKKAYEQLTGRTLGAFTTTPTMGQPFRESPGGELSRMRTVRVSPAAHPSASGTFTIAFSPGKVDEVTQVDGDESLKAMIDRIKAAKFDVEFPDATPARLMRRGIMSCGSQGCDLAVLPPDDRSLLAAE